LSRFAVGSHVDGKLAAAVFTAAETCFHLIFTLSGVIGLIARYRIDIHCLLCHFTIPFAAVPGWARFRVRMA
jgi:hypothetical protein